MVLKNLMKLSSLALRIWPRSKFMNTIMKSRPSAMMIRTNSYLVLSDLSYLYWLTNFWRCLRQGKPKLESRFCRTFWTQIRCSITLTIRIEFLGAPSNKISSTIIWLLKLLGVLKWEQRTPSLLYLRSFSKRERFWTTSNKTSTDSAKSTNKSSSKSFKPQRDSSSSDPWTSR